MHFAESRGASLGFRGFSGGILGAGVKRVTGLLYSVRRFRSS